MNSPWDLVWLGAVLAFTTGALVSLDIEVISAPWMTLLWGPVGFFAVVTTTAGAVGVGVEAGVAHYNARQRENA